MEIVVAGINSRTAPVAVREKVSLSCDAARRLLRRFRDEAAFEEAIVVNTCNRTEFCLVPNGRGWSLEDVLARVAEVKGGPCVSPDCGFFTYTGLAAVNHVFRVAGALDSQVVGEHEVLGQVKDAYRMAVEERTSGLLLNKLMHAAFRVGKRVQTETLLCRGTTSIPGAAVELARRHFGTLEGKTALVIGAGQNAELAARALAGAGAGRILVANRTLTRAQSLADELAQECVGRLARAPKGEAESAPQTDAAAIVSDRTEAPDTQADKAPAALNAFACALPLEELPSALAQADLVISSTMSDGYVLTSANAGAALRAAVRPVLLVDIAVPRDIDPALAAGANVTLYNIDHLDRLIAENVERRRREVPRAEAIVGEEVLNFAGWLATLDVVPTIKRLEERLAKIETAELARFAGKFRPEDRTKLELFARRLSRKMLHEPIAFLRGSRETPGAAADAQALDLVRRMFGLDSGEDDHCSP